MIILEINVGLSSKTIGELNALEVINSLKGRGFEIIKARTQESSSEDGVETCLALKLVCPDGWQDQLAELSKLLGQDCIAIAGFIGQAPYDTFIRKHWVTPDESQYIGELAEKETYPSDHSDLVGIDKWEAAKIRKARFKNQVGGGKFNA